MKCSNCVLGDLHFVIRGELKFRTDGMGKPCGDAEVRATGDQFSMECDTCSASFGVKGWQRDGAGEVILCEVAAGVDEATADESDESDAGGAD